MYAKDFLVGTQTLFPADQIDATPTINAVPCQFNVA